MATMEYIYETPNIGTLLGIAYQTEVSRLTQALADNGLDITTTEYQILRIIFAQDYIQQCEICRILVKDKGYISRSIQSLKRKGYVNVDSVSYKCCMVSLTDKGESMKPILFRIAESLHRQLSGKITQQQMEKLKEILELIIK